MGNCKATMNFKSDGIPFYSIYICKYCSILWQIMNGSLYQHGMSKETFFYADPNTVNPPGNNRQGGDSIPVRVAPTPRQVASSLCEVALTAKGLQQRTQ